MPRHIRFLLFAVLTPLHTHAATPAENARCAVWQRELSFAQSVQRHDAGAFRTHIADDAVFDATSTRPTLGASTIVHDWAAIIAGTSVHLDWYPAQVIASNDGKLVYSSGPYLIDDPAAQATSRYTIGHYATVWRLGADGSWRVAFDGGDGGKPASAAEAASFASGRHARCPAAAARG